MEPEMLIIFLKITAELIPFAITSYDKSHARPV
jgi:hypothetical protein